jgi:hypothetical protein
VQKALPACMAILVGRGGMDDSGGVSFRRRWGSGLRGRSLC